MTPKSMTYGVLPTREEFEEAFSATCGVASVAIANERACAFTDDPRVGTCELTCSELWAEITRARAEWTDEHNERPEGWISDVLGVLGFEWV
jgi:hypothetical protein